MIEGTKRIKYNYKNAYNIEIYDGLIIYLIVCAKFRRYRVLHNQYY